MELYNYDMMFFPEAIGNSNPAMKRKGRRQGRTFHANFYLMFDECRINIYRRFFDSPGITY